MLNSNDKVSLLCGFLNEFLSFLFHRMRVSILYKGTRILSNQDEFSDELQVSIPDYKTYHILRMCTDIVSLKDESPYGY
jgi:hypothetical protein